VVRTISGDVAAILSDNVKFPTDAEKYAETMKQDCCQHRGVHSVPFLGGSVQRGISLMTDGSLHSAYDPITGLLMAGRTKSPMSFLSVAGHVYATALYLAGLDPALRAANKGRNVWAPMRLLKKP